MRCVIAESNERYLNKHHGKARLTKPMFGDQSFVPRCTDWQQHPSALLPNNHIIPCGSAANHVPRSRPHRYITLDVHIQLTSFPKRAKICNMHTRGMHYLADAPQHEEESDIVSQPSAMEWRDK